MDTQQNQGVVVTTAPLEPFWKIVREHTYVDDNETYRIVSLDAAANGGYIMARTYGPNARGIADKIAGRVNAFPYLVDALAEAERGFRSLVELGDLPEEYDDRALAMADYLDKLVGLCEGENE